MAQLAPMMQLRARFEDKCGHPLAGGSVFAFEVGTSTPKATFEDAAGTIPNTHPIKLDYRGEADIFLLTGRYRFVVYSCTGVKIYDVDNVGEWLGNVSAENVIDGNKSQHEINEEQSVKNTELTELIGTSVETEKQRALLAESTLQTNINNEGARAGAAEVLLDTKINNETIRATQAEQVLDNKINANGVGNRAYKTYAEMDADKANIPDKSKVTVTNDPDSTKNGDYQYSSAGGGVFTKSSYDPLSQSKAYTDSVTNINLYRGNSAHNTPFNSSTFDKSTTKLDYNAAEIRYKNLNVTGGISVPYNGELRTKVQVWVKVKSAALNAGTMRFLTQAIKNDGSNFLSVYTNIPDGTTGWFKLTEVALSEANRAVFNRVTVTPHVVSGSDITVEDFYIGESVPTIPFVRVREPLDRIIARTATRKSLLPTWKSYPAATGVTINENGDITIAPGISYPITFTVENASRINYCGYIDQVATGDCRLFFRGYRAATPTTFHDVPYFPTSIGGIEFLGAVQFDALVSSVQLTINNYSTTDSITLRSFDICYDPVAPNGKLKIGDRLDLTKFKSEIVQSVAANKPQKNFSSFPDWSVVAKSSDGKRYALNGIAYSEPVALGNIQTEKRYYVSMPDSVATLGTGTAKLTLYHVKADGNSLGGVSSSITATGMINASITTTAETTAILLRIDLTGDAKVELGRLIISEVPYSSETVFDDLFKEDITGTMLSDWEYPNLSGFTKYGDQTAEYPITEDADGEKVLSIPVTSSTIQYGQGAKFIVNMPADQSKQVVLSFLAKSQYDTTNPTRIWLRLFREGSTAEMTASVRNMVINRDGSWTLNQINIPRNVGAYVVKYAEVFLLTDNTSVVPLQLKRFIQTVGSHNPYVKFIKYANEKPATGLSDFLRLKDALSEQPQTVFSVGRQLFRPLKTVQGSTSDYELINGQSLLPKRLYNLRHIDTDGYLIAFIDRDDNVYLKKGTALYKTTVDDLSSRCVSTSIVGDENRGVFNSTNLPLINPNIPGQWLRVTGNGTLVSVSRSTAHYSIDGGQNWIEATGYQNTNGDNYNAWGVDCSDDIVITSGYKLAAEGRGTGRINFSKDNGKTYQVILDIETSSFIDNARRGSMHIHSVKYDPYWDGVWVVMGDGAFNNPNTSVTSNVWFIENPGTAQQNMISYDCRGQDWTNEQHVSVFPMQDCILFGSDAAPTGLYRMARTKDVKAFRDVAVPISTALSHYGCGGYQHQHYLPAAIYFGKAGESTVSLNDKVFLTYDGVNVVEIYTEPETSNTPSGKVNSFAFALDKYFIFERRTDARFASGNTWIISDIQYMR